MPWNISFRMGRLIGDQEEPADCSNSQKRRVVSWYEQDAYTSWRRLYCYLRRAGVTSKIKRDTHRRERREATREISDGLEDYYS